METIYQVEADYPLRTGGHWTWRRRYFSKHAALQQAARRRKGWEYPGTGWDEADLWVEPAAAVRVTTAPVGEWVTL